MLELTLYLSLFVRRWCRAFLFDSLSMEEDFAEDVCQLVDVLRILRNGRVWRSHPVSHESSYWSSFWVGLANVHISRNRPTSDAEMSCLRYWFSHSTSTSASPVPPVFSVIRPLTNAANTDMKGCPIWCSFFLSPPRCMPFPAPWLLRTVGMRTRLPPPAMCDRETLRVDVWIGHTVAGARLDDRSGVRCVRDDVPVSLLIDSSVFSRSQSLHLRYLENPLPSSDRQMRSQASARFWLSMTLFGVQRFHPCVFLPSDPRRGTRFSSLRALPTAEGLAV